MVNSHSGYTFLQYAEYGNYWVWHPGWDYNGPGSGNADAGLPISSVANGLVVFAPPSKPTQWGSIVIQHLYKGETIYSQYGHMRKVYVKEGDIVSKGKVIGELGGVPNFSAHLHWEIRKSNHPNPTNANFWNPKAFQNKDTVNSWYYDPQWWVDNHGPYEQETQVDPKYLLTFNGVGGVELLASKEEVERTFGAPKEKALQKMHEYSTDPKDLTEVLEAYIYEGLTIYFYKDKMVYFEVMSPKYRTYYNIGVGSSIGSLLETYSDLKREEAFDAYYFEFPKSSVFSDRRTYFFERNGKIDYIIIGLKDYLPEC